MGLFITARSGSLAEREAAAAGETRRWRRPLMRPRGPGGPSPREGGGSRGERAEGSAARGGSPLPEEASWGRSAGGGCWVRPE